MMVDTGNQTVMEQSEQINMFVNLVRNALSIDILGGTMEARFRPPGLDSMLFFPKRHDENTEIITMQGDHDVPDVYDLELLYKQLFAGAKIPKAYLGFEENTGIAQASLVSQDIRFARMIRVLRKPIIIAFHQLAEIQLALKGYDPTQYNIEVHMSKISGLEEELNAATLEKQIDFASTLSSLCQSLEIPNREIIDLVFREYLHVPRRFVDLAKLSASIEQALGKAKEDQMAMGGGGGGGMMGGGMGGMGGLDSGFMGPDQADMLGDDLGLDDADMEGGEEEQKPQEALKPMSFTRRRLEEERRGIKKPVKRQAVVAKKIPLTEGDIKRFKNLISPLKEEVKALEHLNENLDPTDERNKKVKLVEKALWESRQSVRATADIIHSGKTSLVEDLAGKRGRQLMEFLPSATGKKQLLQESAKVTNLTSGTQVTHPQVKTLKQIRRKHKE
jgi:hypothetical protein